MIEVVAGALGSALLFLGLTVATIGLIGMFRFPNLFEQLHAAGLITGPAAILVLIASLASGSVHILTSAILVVAFILVTSSLSTHVIALAAWRERDASGRGGRRAHGGAIAGVDGVLIPEPMHLVVAHDGTPGAGTALDLAAALRWPDDSHIHVVAVTEGDLPSLADSEPGAEARERRDERPPAPLARVALEAAADRLAGPGRRVEPVVRGGDPATAIVEEAEAIDADLVIVGTRGQGRVRALLAGSVAAGVLDRAACPVLVARGPVVRTVLLATDGSAASDAAVRIVAQWPLFTNVDVQVLSVATLAPQYRELPPLRTMRDATLRSRHRDHADEAVSTLRAAGRRAVAHVRPGDPAQAISSFADERSIDLIVIGSRGRTGLRRTLLGSVARDVLGATQASVLVVRATR